MVEITAPQFVLAILAQQTPEPDWVRLITPVFYLLFFVMVLALGIVTFLRWWHQTYRESFSRAKPTPTDDVWSMHVPPEDYDVQDLEQTDEN